MLGFPLHYSEGLRLWGFQLFGVYCKLLCRGVRRLEAAAVESAGFVKARGRQAFNGLWFGVWDLEFRV